MQLDHLHPKEQKVKEELVENLDLWVMMDHQDHQDLQVKEENQDPLEYQVLMD